MTMNGSNNTTSITEAGRSAGYIPQIRPNPTIEEIDEWIGAIGGREITPEEAAAFDQQVKWAPVPGEDQRGNPA